MISLEKYVQKLQAANTEIALANKRGYVPVKPKKTEELRKKVLEKVSNTDIKSVNPFDAGKLFQKAKEKFVGQRDDEFTGRERRMLLAIYMYAAEIEGMPAWVLDQIDWQKSSSCRKALFTYFRNYQEKNTLTILLRERICRCLQEHPDFATRFPSLQKAPFLLDENGVYVFAEHLTKGIQAYLRQIIFSEPLWRSKYVIHAIQELFAFPSVPAGDKLERLQEIQKAVLCQQGKKIPLYKNLIHYVASSLIFSVDKSRNGQQQDQLIQILQRELGDPRANNSKWLQVDSRALAIYKKWLCRVDFELFFSIFDATADRSMWEPRRDFWSNYVKYMDDTWPILGPDAVWKARALKRENVDEKLDHLMYGTLKGSGQVNKSLFVFAIGKYICCEGSHNTKIRVWKEENSPIKRNDFHTRKTIEYSDITGHGGCETIGTQYDGLTHDPYAKWKDRMKKWLQNYCGI